MGLFWELWQQSKIGESRTKAESLDERVEELEFMVQRLEFELENLYRQLDEYFGTNQAVSADDSIN